MTLSERSTSEQTTRIATLAAAGLPPGWAVKDSFGRLDLRGLGLRVLFEAQWLWHTPSPAHDVEGRPGGSSARRLFPDALLADPDVAFIAHREDRAIVGGAIGSLRVWSAGDRPREAGLLA